ncbi:MAG: alanine racemase [Rikenellaceae bacterium]
MKYLLSKIAEICKGELVGSDCIVEDLLTDSRRSGGGSQTLFVAMEGQNHDSHNFIGEMLHRGTEAFMVERRDAITDEGSFILVENSLVALQRLAAFHRSQFHGEVVAIVGSNGKTIVKEWVAQSYLDDGKLSCSPRSYNSQLGVALSLLICSGDEDIALIEAGVSMSGEMSHLEEMIRPDVVAVTSIGDAHQQGFSSVEQKIEEKLKIASRAKKVIYHSQYPQLAEYFSNQKDRDYELIDAAKMAGANCEDITSKRNSQVVEAILKVCGCKSYNLDNFTPVAMRLEVKEGLNDSVIVNDSYNLCVNSLSIALDALNSVAAGRPTTLILSEILQSGVSPEILYSNVAKVISAAKVDRVIGVGGGINQWLDCSYFNSTEELLSKLRREDYAQRAILIKGNRESRFERVSHSLERKCHTTRLEVNLDAMISNLNFFRQKISAKTKLVAMVKASSYGAGDYEIAKTLEDQGVDYLAVAFVDEGVVLREAGITMPTIVLNADDDSFEQMIHQRLEPEIYSLRSLQQFIEAIERNGETHYPIHIKIDSGMHRLGFQEDQIEELSVELNKNRDRVKVASIFSHLSCADEPNGREFTFLQVKLFNSICEQLNKKIEYRPMRHIANSAAMERYTEAEADCCRLGIGLYGFGLNQDQLTPISTLKSRIVQIKRYEAGAKIGYGAAGVTTRESQIATVPIGYADGLRRDLGCGNWSMIVRGEKAPIIGRVCMDSVMVDVTDISGVKEGDNITIFSAEKGNSVADMATILGTIPYEILTSISRRVKRVYLKE